MKHDQSGMIGTTNSGGGLSLGGGSLGGGSLGGVDDALFELFDHRRQLYDADERALFRSLLMTLDSYTCQVDEPEQTHLSETTVSGVHSNIH